MNKIIAKYFFFLPGQALRGEYTMKYIHQFEKSQWLSKEKLEEIQWQKMVSVFRYAFENSPHYKKIYKKHGVTPDTLKSINDLTQIPYLTKDDLRYNQKDMLTPLAEKERLSQKTTGGSTGQAVTVLKSMHARAYQDAAMWRSLRWFGIDIGDRQARFWGVPFSKTGRTKEKIIDFMMNRIRLSGFNYDAKAMFKFYQELKRFKPKYFYGYVSMIKDFAYFCIENKIPSSKLDLHGIVTTSEPLYDDTKQLLEETFYCPIINDYGSGETGPIAYTCPENGFHLMSDNLFIEIVTEHKKHAIAGEKGEVVVTELNNYSMPLIRYNLKDIVEVSDKVCPCGRSLQLIENVAGRDRDVLIASNGQKVHGAYINYIAQTCKSKGLGLKQYQVVQKEAKLIIVNLIVDYGYTDESEQYIIGSLKKVLGKDVKIKINIVDHINREKSGKLRVVKCEIS